MKKNIGLFVAVIILAIFALVGCFFYPYFRLYSEIKSVNSQNGFYELLLLTKDDDNSKYVLDKRISGLKEEQKICGTVDSENYISFFYDFGSKELLLNAMSLCSPWTENLGENWITQNMEKYLSDVFISQKQLQTILDDENVTIGKFEEMPPILMGYTEKMKFHRVHLPKEYEEIDGSKYFFAVGTDCYIGVDAFEQSDNGLLILYKSLEKIKQIEIKYVPDNTVKLSVPKAELSDELVDKLRYVYKIYKMLK